MRFFCFKKKKIKIIFFFSNSLVLNFAIFKLSRNSQNKSHANIKCFTVFRIECWCSRFQRL